MVYEGLGVSSKLNKRLTLRSHEAEMLEKSFILMLTWGGMKDAPIMVI